MINISFANLQCSKVFNSFLLFNLRYLRRYFPHIFATLGFSYYLIRNNYLKRLAGALYGRTYKEKNYPKIITNLEECIFAVNELRRDCENVPVLGMDCEWLPDNKTATKVALLQLATINGSCSLFRLCKIGYIPQCLSELLSDKSIWKTGVAVTNDARKLIRDYGVNCQGCIDVRYMAKEVGLTALGLGKMSQLYLDVELDKSWRLRCSDWEADALSDKQIDYAAKDAVMSLYLFEFFNEKYVRKCYPWWKRMFWTNNYYWFESLKNWFRFRDIGFSEKAFSSYQSKGSKNGKKSNVITDFDSIHKRLSVAPPKDNFRNFSSRADIVRKTPLYHNIFVQAPDGMVLCTCDDKKANWYLNKGIAHIVKEDPLTVRLNFEPSGRKGGGEGYYARVKNNICVVCGSSKSMRRKNIVPHEYRKHFPAEVKEHSSHDVLLFCDFCHYQSQFNDIQLRSFLAKECDAPLGINDGNQKVLELPKVKQVKSAARALLNNANVIPPARRRELESLVINFLEENSSLLNIYEYHLKDSQEIDKKVLERLGTLHSCVENEHFIPHGMKVVEYYTKKGENGIHSLEQLWRNHFIKSMNPQHLPELWSVDYIHTNLT